MTLILTFCNSTCKAKFWAQFHSKDLDKVKACLFTSKTGGASDNDKQNGVGDEAGLPDPPTNCCMSGCANCVYIEYAQQLTEIFKDAGERSQQIILSKITDPNMQAFLRTELAIMAMKAKNKNNKNGK